MAALIVAWIGAGREALRVEAEVADDVAREAVGVGLVVDRELLRVAELVGVAPQDPHARGVERGHPHLLGDRPDERPDAVLHLVGGLVGERDGQDLERADAVLADQVGDAVGEHPRLARARRPATMSSGPSVWVTASRWTGFSPSRRASSAGLMTRPRYKPPVTPPVRVSRRSAPAGSRPRPARRPLRSSRWAAATRRRDPAVSTCRVASRRRRCHGPWVTRVLCTRRWGTTDVRRQSTPERTTTWVSVRTTSKLRQRSERHLARPGHRPVRQRRQVRAHLEPIDDVADDLVGGDRQQDGRGGRRVVADPSVAGDIDRDADTGPTLATGGADRSGAPGCARGGSAGC